MARNGLTDYDIFNYKLNFFIESDWILFLLQLGSFMDLWNKDLLLLYLFRYHCYANFTSELLEK